MASLLSISTPTATLTFSDIDSDAAAAILHRTIRHRPAHSASRASQPPTPGTRRFRRYLNALVSADEGDGGSSSEYYSQSEAERDEGEPEVWRSEWKGEFVRVGDDFFDGTVGLPKRAGREETGSRLQRRVKTIERERLERRRERRERLERRERRLAAAEQLATSAASSETTVAGSELEDGSLAALRAQRIGARVRESEYVMVDEEELDKKDDSLDAHEQEEEDELMTTNSIAGDALTHDLWRCIDKSTRQLLRHMDDFAFLHALEQLLLAFKAHCAHSQPSSPFQPPPLPPSSARFFTPLPSPVPGEVALHVPDAFLRHLLYGALQWHVMYSAGRGSGSAAPATTGRGRRGGREACERDAVDVGVVCVRMQRGCVYHECRLERFIQQHYGARR